MRLADGNTLVPMIYCIKLIDTKNILQTMFTTRICSNMEIPLERHDVSDCIGIIHSGLSAEHFGLIGQYLLPDHSVPLVLSRVRFSAIPCP